jgi:hypothetical protein
VEGQPQRKKKERKKRKASKQGENMPRDKGGKNYSIDKQKKMLDVIESMLPIGSEEWNKVAFEYNRIRKRGSSERDPDSLKRKFKSLYSFRKPTGDPTILETVRRAKLIKREIDSRCDTVVMQDGVDGDFHNSGSDEEPEIEDNFQTPKTNYCLQHSQTNSSSEFMNSSHENSLSRDSDCSLHLDDDAKSSTVTSYTI